MKEEKDGIKSGRVNSSGGLMEQYAAMSKQYLKIVIAWCFSLLMMNCTFLAFTFYKIDQVATMTESQKGSCIAIGVLLHYSLVASFCFSFCITLVQFLIIYKSFKIFKQIFLKSLVFSMGKYLYTLTYLKELKLLKNYSLKRYSAYYNLNRARNRSHGLYKSE